MKEKKIVINEVEGENKENLFVKVKNNFKKVATNKWTKRVAAVTAVVVGTAIVYVVVKNGNEKVANELVSEVVETTVDLVTNETL